MNYSEDLDLEIKIDDKIKKETLPKNGRSNYKEIAVKRNDT